MLPCKPLILPILSLFIQLAVVVSIVVLILKSPPRDELHDRPAPDPLSPLLDVADNLHQALLLYFPPEASLPVPKDLGV